MGGSIWVESKENEGSTFYFTVRMNLQSQHTKPRFLALPVLDKTPVLVIEDNALSRECIVRILENFRMIPTAVDNGEKAIIELKRAVHRGNPYPLVLMDISLSGKMDGFDIAEYIKEDRSLADTDMIVVSMSQQASDREKFARLGIDQYFTKPYSQSDLLDSIQNTLSGRNKNACKTIQDDPGSLSQVIAENKETMKILLVEDNIVNQEVAASMLDRRGHTVIIARNGAEAIAAYKKEYFDLILMDVQMPVLNGYEATGRIRAFESEFDRYTPVIGLTANAMKGDREKCIEAGMDDYVSKPIRIADLLAAIDRIKQKNTMVEKMDGTICRNLSIG